MSRRNWLHTEQAAAPAAGHGTQGTGHRASNEDKAIFSVSVSVSCIASDSMRAIWEGGVGWVDAAHGE